ncbi:MAG TPA: DUF4870 domain-containing protein [bacterium]|nr:DUF4870 domain-containing protein [Caldisericia bacterium]HQG78952.1 DUF4870 domain-containing protein [bacterium]
MNQTVNGQERTWAMLCHLSALAFVFGIPFANIIAPLIIWLVKRNEYPLVDYHGKESINFQITITIISIVCVILAFVLVGFVLLFIVAVLNVIMIIIAAVKVSKGEDYSYSFSFNFIK